MNRAARRAARRAGHDDCGCAPRLLSPVESTVTCAECGASGPAPLSLTMPTAAPAGSLKTIWWSGPICDHEIEVLCEVGS